LSSHGQAAKVDAVNVQCVEEVEDVVCEKLDGIRAGGGGRLAVAASVVAKEVVPRVEGWELGIPHGEIRAERIGEDEDRGGLVSC